MLDLRFIREHTDRVKKAAADKGYRVDVDRLINLDDERRELLQQVENLRQRRNGLSEAAQGQRPRPEHISEAKQLKSELFELEEKLKKAEAEVRLLQAAIPNVTDDDVPVGGEADSVEIKVVGGRPTGAKDHLDYALGRDWVDFERGAKVAGAKFYYLKGDLALLENAITQFALQFVLDNGFTYMTVPHLVNSRTLTGTGFAPRTSDQSDEYALEGEDLSLIATAEIPLTGYHADEIIDEDKLPLLYAGYSPCYRKEAGTYGKHTRGLFRVHQFNKLEMYAFTAPEQSRAMHQRLLAIEEELWQAIGIPYHVINIASGDLGAPAAKKYDIEFWSPVDAAYRELTSCSNCTDYQTHNLNIRVRRSNGRVELAHSLNGTAVSLARSLVAIIEHYQQPDGSLKVPQVLQPYLGGRKSL